MESNIENKIKKVINLVENYNTNSESYKTYNYCVWEFHDEDSQPISNDMGEIVEEAKNLSLHIAKELRKMDKESYNFKFIEMNAVELDNLIDKINKNEPIDFRLYDLIFIKGQQYGRNIRGIMLFISDSGPKYKQLTNFHDRHTFPSSWYLFCQMNGLLKSGMVELYNLSKFYEVGNERVFPSYFLSFSKD